MEALKAFGGGKVELVEEPVPSISADEILISPLAVGICGTDLDIVGSKIDPAFVHYPVTLGHEWCGVVIGMGSGVTSFALGDRVVVQGIIPCEICRECKTGNTNRCEIYDEYGFTRPGACSSAVVAHQRLVHRMLPHVTNESGALVEPASVVITGLMKANPFSDAKVLIIGDGTIGLIAATLVRQWAPRQVDLVGLRNGQAVLARAAKVDNFYADIRENDEKYDFVIEASGSRSGIESAFLKLVRGGKLLLLGFIGHQESIPLLIDDVINGDLSIFGSFGYTSQAWAKTVDLLNSGELDLTFLVTHRFDLADWEKGFDALVNAPAPRGKILLIPRNSI